MQHLKLGAHFPIGSVSIVPFKCSVYVLCVLCTSGFNCPPSACVCAFLVCALVFAQRVSSRIIPSVVRGERRGGGGTVSVVIYFGISPFSSPVWLLSLCTMSCSGFKSQWACLWQKFKIFLRQIDKVSHAHCLGQSLELFFYVCNLNYYQYFFSLVRRFYSLLLITVSQVLAGFLSVLQA